MSQFIHIMFSWGNSSLCEGVFGLWEYKVSDFTNDMIYSPELISLDKEEQHTIPKAI